jgi:YidC/Oxa1 family membrane protein insertase
MTQAETHQLINDAVRIEVSSQGGRLTSVELLQFHDRVGEPWEPVQLVTDPSQGTGLLLLGEEDFRGLESTLHQVVSSSDREVVYRVESGGVEVQRSWTLDDRGYGLRLQVSVSNQSPLTVRPRFEIVWLGRERTRDAPDRFQNYQVVASADGGLERQRVEGIHAAGFLGRLFGRGAPTGEPIAAPVEWVGVESQYFLTAVIAEDPREAWAFRGPVAPDTAVSSLRYPAFDLPPGQQFASTHRVYLGPKVHDAVQAVDPRLLPAVNVGWSWVRPLVELFAAALTWTYGHLVSNYGVAIILLTIVLRLATYPLTQRSMKSMKRLQQISPEMKELQAKHKGDNAKLQQEMAALYKRTGINPATAMAGGCLPMALQMPFMLALYFALQGTIELRHAPFMLWINDLSAPENLFSIMGVPVRLLPLLMGASMLGQQWLQPATGDPQQRQMMMWMNVLFIFLFYQFPSGLVLYWFVSNLLGIAQQLLVNRQPSGAKAGAT